MDTVGAAFDNRPHRCFGVTLLVDETDAGSKQLAQTFDVLTNSFASAIENARQKIAIDRSRAAIYKTTKSHFLITPEARARRTTTGVSLLDHCGLPRVNRFGNFLNDFLRNQVSPKTIPFVGCGRSTLATLWNPSGLSQVIDVGFGDLADYYGNLNFLARVNPDDGTWRGAGQQSWFDTFGTGLTGYMTELFSERFVDRNGTRVSFESGVTPAALTRLDSKQVAPQIAGAIVSTLVEFLGDELFKVPCYSREILSKYRDYRGRNGSQIETIADLKKLTDAVQNGTLSGIDASVLLGIPSGGGDLPVVFDRLLQGKTETPVVASSVARMVHRKIDRLDCDYVAALSAVASSIATLDSIETKKSDLQKTFTCFKTGVIPDHLQCLFVSDTRPAKQGVCGRDNDTGQSSGDRTDYADLVGTLVAFGGTAAEKSVRSLVGGLIRGIAIASLQNEVIAEIVASLAGTLAKKLVESVTYQAFQSYIADEGSGDPDAKRTVLNLLAQIHGTTTS